MAAAAPPQVHKALCFGKFAIPTDDMTLAHADGNFRQVPMVDLSRTTAGWLCYTWFWQQLEVSRKSFKKGTPYSLPLVLEIKAAISAARHKRKRDGKFYDEAGRPVPQALVITLRGKQLVVLNDARKLVLCLTDPEDLMCWFVSELWQELHDVSGGEVSDEAEAEVDAPDPEPLEDEPHAEQSPAEEPGPWGRSL